MFEDQVTCFVFANLFAEGKKNKGIDVAQPGIGKDIQQRISFSVSRIIFLRGNNRHLVIPGKIFIKKRNTFLSAGSCRKEGIRYQGDDIHFTGLTLNAERLTQNA